MANEELKLCPLVKDECAEEACMWYVVRSELCAINLLGQAADAIEEYINED